MNTKDYKSSLGTYVIYCLLFTIPAIILGLAINRITMEIKKWLNPPIVLLVLIQLLIAILVLYIIETYISSKFSSGWQSNTPGLFFVAIYFGLQTLLYADIVAGIKRPGIFIPYPSKK